MPPQVNARLTKISNPGGGDDFHGQPGPDTLLFNGSAEAFYDQTRHRVTGFGGDGRGSGSGGEGAVSDVIVSHTLLLDPLPLRPEVGQVVEFIYRDTTYSGSIQAVEDPILPGIPDSLNTVTLTLELT